MIPSRIIGIITIIVLVLIAGSGDLFACPTCYGDPESPMTDGMNAAILFLLGVTGSVLVAVAALFLFLRRRWVSVNKQFQHMMN